MTVLSVLRSGAARLAGLPSATPINTIGLGKPTNVNQLVRNCGLIILRNISSSGKGQTGTGSGIRVSEYIKYPKFQEFKITPSRYPWQKYKDIFHFYFFLGAIPCTIVIILVNIFVGPPTLAIPEPDYIPKHWEYQRHPITQCMTRYIFPSYQETYERNLFYVREEEEKRRMRLLAWKAEALMRERGDFYGYYGTKTLLPKYYRQSQEENKRVFDGMGDPIDDSDVFGRPLDR